MTAATKKNNVLKERDELLKVLAKQTEVERRLAAEHTLKVSRFRELFDERNRLLHRSPELFDHHGNALDPKNAGGSIDAEINGLGDIADLAAQVNHSRALKAKAEEAIKEFDVAHYDELVEVKWPEGEAKVAAVRAAADQFRAALDEWHGCFQYGVSLTVGLQDLHGGHVPGVEHFAALKKACDEANLPVPLARRP